MKGFEEVIPPFPTFICHDFFIDLSAFTDFYIQGFSIFNSNQSQRMSLSRQPLAKILVHVVWKIILVSEREKLILKARI